MSCKKKNSMGEKRVSIALDFPLEFRDFFCIHYSRNTERALLKIVGKLSECSLEKSSERKKKSMG